MNIRRCLFSLLIVAWLVLMAADFPQAPVDGSIPVQLAIVILFFLIEVIILRATNRAKKRQAPAGEIWRLRGLSVLLLLPQLAWTFFPATERSLPDVYFQNLTINGQPAQMILDTGSAITALESSGAYRLRVKAALTGPGEAQIVMKSGVGVWVWSDPVRLSCGNQIFTLPLPIGTEPTELAQLNRRDEVDGRIGWPEVRDNILVFDPRRHTVRRVEKLPAETAGWLKFKVHQDERFLIDLPLPNGKTGTVLVDTGDQGGVSLPLEQWIAWQAAHPQAAVSTHHYVGPETGSGTNEIAWADEFTLGGLTLTQVQIGEAPSAVGEGIVNYAGTLGMDVLERMDLVVDGPGGYAYLKPRPSSDQADSASARNAADYAIGNWSVDGNVRLRDGYIRALPYALRGLDKLKKGDADGAIADFTQALQFAPGDAYDVYSDRGNAKKDKGDFAGAVADYSRALEFDPANGSDYENQALARIALGDYDGAIADYTHLIKLFPEDFWYPFRRGVARQIQGDFQGALADYDRTVELNPNDSPHSRLNREVLRLRLGTAPVDFAENLSGWPDGWMKTIGQFVAGQLDATALLAVAGSGDSGPAKARRSVADYYIGISQLLKGDQAGAKASFQDSLAVGDKMTDEYQLSRAELAKLKDSSQP